MTHPPETTDILDTMWHGVRIRITVIRSDASNDALSSKWIWRLQIVSALSLGGVVKTPQDTLRGAFVC